MQNNNYDIEIEIVKDNKSIENVLDELGVSIEHNPFENEEPVEENMHEIK